VSGFASVFTPDLKLGNEQKRASITKTDVNRFGLSISGFGSPLMEKPGNSINSLKPGKYRGAFVRIGKLVFKSGIVYFARISRTLMSIVQIFLIY